MNVGVGLANIIRKTWVGLWDGVRSGISKTGRWLILLLNLSRSASPGTFPCQVGLLISREGWQSPRYNVKGSAGFLPYMHARFWGCITYCISIHREHYN